MIRPSQRDVCGAAIEARNWLCRRITRSKFKRGPFVLVALAASILSVSGTASANLVANGSFESPNRSPTNDDGGTLYFYEKTTINADGWSRIGVKWAWLESRLDGWVASNGNQFTELESGFAAAIFTTFATQVGEAYLVSYDYAADPFAASGDSDDSIEVLINGLRADYADGVDFNRESLDWMTRTFAFVATTTITELRFADGLANVSYTGPFLDNVSVSVVPEPKCYAFILAGLTLVGWAARARRPAPYGTPNSSMKSI